MYICSIYEFSFLPFIILDPFLFLFLGANLAVKSVQGLDPLHTALRMRDWNLLFLLLHYGAGDFSVDFVNSFFDFWVFFYSLIVGRFHSFHILLFFIFAFCRLADKQLFFFLFFLFLFFSFYNFSTFFLIFF